MINFLRVDTTNDFALMIKNTVPYAKIAVLSLVNSDFLQITKELKRQGLKPINIFVQDDFHFSVESACGLFNIPDDTRAVITKDPRLYNIVNYIASIKNIQSFLILTDSIHCGISSKKFIFKDEGQYVRINFTCSTKIVLINEMITERFILDSYFNVVIRAIGLQDYLFKCYLCGEDVDIVFFTNIKREITKTVGLLSNNDFEQIIERGINSEKLCGENQDFFVCCAPLVYSFIICGNAFDKQTLFPATLEISDEYCRAFNDEADSVPDYNQRVKEFCFLSNTRLLWGLRSINSQLLNLNPNKDLLGWLQKEIFTLNRLIENMKKEYFAIVRNVFKRLDKKEKRLLCFSGDLRGGENGMTFIREFFNKIKIKK